MITELKSVLLDDFWIMPQTPKYTESGIPYVTSKNIKNEKINFENVNYISIEDYKKISKNRPILKNDILISMIGTLGETAIVDDSYGEFYGQNMFLVRLDNSKIDYRYFINFFKSTYVKNHLARKQNKSTQSYLKAKHIESLMIPVITIKEQKEIANQLDKVQDLIKLKTQQIEKLDDLIKSQFVEMFGEPLTSNNYGRVTLDKLTKVNQGLQIPISKRFNEDGKDRYKYITIQYLNGGKQTEYIENPNDRVICKKDDILMTRTGNTGQVITNVEGVFHNNFFKVDYDREKLNKEFLIKYFEDDGIYRDMIRRATTSTIPDLSHSEFYKMSIDLPPIELQNEFAELVKQINQQKFEIEKSLKEMQELYESLMDKYFG